MCKYYVGSNNKNGLLQRTPDLPAAIRHTHPSEPSFGLFSLFSFVAQPPIITIYVINLYKKNTNKCTITR